MRLATAKLKKKVKNLIQIMKFKTIMRKKIKREFKRFLSKIKRKISKRKKYNKEDRV